MTTVSSIIQSAYRESNIIVIGATPTTDEIAEALDRFNAILLSTVGNEAGDGLDDLNIGGTYDRSSYCSSWVPDNARLMLNLSAAKTLNLDPDPYEGQRISIVDVAGNLATRNLILNGNGRLIEGATSLTLNTNSMTRQWLYRSDTGNWVKIAALVEGDTMPFPIEFDDFFIVTLALRLNPRHSATIGQESIEALKRYRSQLRGRYHNYKQIKSDLDTRGYSSDPRTSGFLNTDEFNTGRPWPFL